MELHVRQEPSDRARVLAEMIEQAWHDFTEAERLDVLVLLNRTHAVPIDRIAIEKMLEANNGHIGRTAEALGICRYTLQQKMRALGMPPAKRGPKRKLV